MAYEYEAEHGVALSWVYVYYREILSKIRRWFILQRDRTLMDVFQDIWTFNSTDSGYRAVSVVAQGEEQVDY